MARPPPLPLELHLVLERFERVVHYRAVARPVDQLPHAAHDRSVAAHHVGKFLAAFGARVVDGAFVAAQEDAAGLLVAPQDETLLLALHHVFRHYARRLDAEIPPQALHVALRHLRRRHPAAVAALQAIDRVFNTLGNPAQDAVRVIEALHVLAETFVFRPLLFA